MVIRQISQKYSLQFLSYHPNLLNSSIFTEFQLASLSENSIQLKQPDLNSI
jgi:hypothetical protein